MASSSSGLSMVASQLDEWCHYLVPVGGAGISETVGGEAVGVLPCLLYPVVGWLLASPRWWLVAHYQ